MFVEFEMQSWYGLLWIKQYCNIHTNQDLVVIKSCGKTRVEESMHIVEFMDRSYQCFGK